jgi:hypothetical protein
MSIRPATKSCIPAHDTARTGSAPGNRLVSERNRDAFWGDVGEETLQQAGDHRKLMDGDTPPVSSAHRCPAPIRGRSTLLKCRPIRLDSASYQGLGCLAYHGERPGRRRHHLPASTLPARGGAESTATTPPEAVQRLRSGGGKGPQPPAASYRAWRASARRGGGAWHDSTVRKRAGCSVG